MTRKCFPDRKAYPGQARIAASPPNRRAPPRVYDGARRAMAELLRVDEVKSILDKAKAAAVYAAHAKNRELLDRAIAYQTRAAPRLGELLIEMAELGQRQKAGDADGRRPQPSVPKLADLGVTKSQSSRWQTDRAGSAGCPPDPRPSGSACSWLTNLSFDRHRDGKGECRPLPISELDPDAAAVHCNDALGDR